MDGVSIVADWKRRLLAMAENPPHVFRDTPQSLIKDHQRHLTTFAGYSEPEVAQAEARLGVQFPVVFRTFLRELAKSPGDLFRGSDLAGPADFERFRTDALSLLAETDPALTLPREAVVFLFHQGYTFTYLLAAGGFDGPTMQWTETEREPEQAAETFVDMIDAELRLMESNHAAAHEQGGSYLTLHPDGGASEELPALNSGDRPLDRERPGRRWWDFWR
jgi:hypothetical protein